MRLVPAVPLRPCAARRSTAGTAHHTRQPLLHVLAEPFVRDQLGHLRSAGTTLGMPLRDRRLVLEPPRPRRCVTAKLPRDRRRAPMQPPRDLPHAETLRCRIAISSRSANDRKRPDTSEDDGFTPPAWRNHRNATGDDTPASPAASSVFSPRATARPEPDPILRHATVGRPGEPPAPIQLNLPLPLPHRPHLTPPSSRCCDDHLNPPCDARVGVRRSGRRRRGRGGRAPSARRRGRVRPACGRDRPADDAAAVASCTATK